MEYADRVGGSGKQVQNVQAVVSGEQVDVVQAPVLLAGLLAGDLRLGLSESGGQVVLALTGPRHQRGDREPEEFLGSHHDATLASLMRISYISRMASPSLHTLTTVIAGLALLWISSAVEGHVKRIKMLKRQTLGRADFNLLRKKCCWRDGCVHAKAGSSGAYSECRSRVTGAATP
ncbi:hypothetical protein [Streptomyces sp. NPDC051909]|uniref:hypothetical protein n=1 Tax=Streptomyces sp. NPDC051909 TaxID=3154944 RepID=UPI003446A651